MTPPPTAPRSIVSCASCATCDASSPSFSDTFLRSLKTSSSSPSSTSSSRLVRDVQRGVVEPLREAVDVRQRRAHADDLRRSLRRRRRRRRGFTPAAARAQRLSRSRALPAVAAVRARAHVLRRDRRRRGFRRREQELREHQFQRAAAGFVLDHVQLVHDDGGEVAHAVVLDEFRDDVVRLLRGAHEEDALFRVSRRQRAASAAVEPLHVDVYQLQEFRELVRAFVAQGDKREDDDREVAAAVGGDGVLLATLPAETVSDEAFHEKYIRDDRLPSARGRAVHQVLAAVGHARRREALRLPRVQPRDVLLVAVILHDRLGEPLRRHRRLRIGRGMGRRTMTRRRRRRRRGRPRRRRERRRLSRRRRRPRAARARALSPRA
eukprot:27760-Pelagococcus_subviridis.AAC.10